MVTTELLRNYACFSDLSEAKLEKLASIAEEFVFPAGERVFTEYDPAAYFYLVADGEVKLQHELGSGELRDVDTLLAGELLVWSAFVEPYRCTATCTASKDSRLVAFDASKLRQMCDEDSDLGYEFMSRIVRLLARRVNTARIQLSTI